MKGKVIFIGGGPGDPELLTIKAYQTIQEADVIIYAGSLVNKEVLRSAKPTAEIHNSASMNLDEIITLTDEAIKEGKLVARVHTGDPSIYGAIGEQIQELRKREISYEIIPGVSSLFAATAALENELTLPDISQTVIITRPEGRTPKPGKEAIKLLAEHQTTMCIFLGVQVIGEVVKDLRTHYPPNTPVAVVKKASWPDEEIIRGTLEDIEDKVRKSGIKKTALIIIGRVLDPGTIKPSKLYHKDFQHEYRK